MLRSSESSASPTAGYAGDRRSGQTGGFATLSVQLEEGSLAASGQFLVTTDNWDQLDFIRRLEALQRLLELVPGKLVRLAGWLPVGGWARTMRPWTHLMSTHSMTFLPPA